MNEFLKQIQQVYQDPMTLFSLIVISLVFVGGFSLLLLPLWWRRRSLSELNRQCKRITLFSKSDAAERSSLMKILISKPWMSESVRRFELQWRSAFVERCGAAVGAVRLSDFITPDSVLPRMANRYLAGALPGILVALGILGTFMGLVKGLPALTVKPDAAEGISGLINVITQSLGLAFYTSIFGIAFSVLFLVADRVLTRHIELEVEELSDEVGRHFKTLPGEELQRLNLKLFEEMTDLLRHMATDFAANLSNMLPPAISEAIDSKLTPALGGIKESIDAFSHFVGEQQTTTLKEMADTVAKTMNSAVGSQLEQLAEVIQGTVTCQQQLNELLDDFRRRLADSTSGQLQLIEKTENAARTLGSSLNRLEEIGKTLEKSAGDILLAGKGLEASASAALDAQREAKRAQDDLLKSLQEQSNALSGAAQEFQASWAAAVEKALGAISQIQEATRQLGDGIGDTLLKALESFDGAVAEVVSRFSGTLAQVDASVGELPPLAASLKDGAEGLSKTVGTLNDNVVNMERSILGHFSDIVRLALDAASRIQQQTATIEEMLGGASRVQVEFTNASKQLALTAKDLSGIREEIGRLNASATGIMPLIPTIESRLAALITSLDTNLVRQIGTLSDAWTRLEPAIIGLRSLPTELNDMKKAIGGLSERISERIAELNRQGAGNKIQTESSSVSNPKTRTSWFRRG